MKKSIILIISSVLLLTLAGGFLFNYSLASDDKIYENVFVENINVGKLSKKEAVDLINSKYSIGNINLIHEDKKITLNLNG